MNQITRAQTTFIKFMREVKVTVIFHSRIKHGSFASLCIGENYVTVIRAICVISVPYKC